MRQNRGLKREQISTVARMLFAEAPKPPQGVLSSLPIIFNLLSAMAHQKRKQTPKKKSNMKLLKKFSQTFCVLVRLAVEANDENAEEKVLLALLIGFWLGGEICLKREFFILPCFHPFTVVCCQNVGIQPAFIHSRIFAFDVGRFFFFGFSPLKLMFLPKNVYLNFLFLIQTLGRHKFKISRGWSHNITASKAKRGSCNEHCNELEPHGR